MQLQVVVSRKALSSLRRMLPPLASLHRSVMLPCLGGAVPLAAHPIIPPFGGDQMKGRVLTAGGSYPPASPLTQPAQKTACKVLHTEVICHTSSLCDLMVTGLSAASRQSP